MHSDVQWQISLRRTRTASMGGFAIRRSSLILFFTATSLVTVCRAQDFSPHVQTKCIDGRMLATVRTAGPFRGIIYASERQSECRALGKGAKETLIDIPLTDFDRCNVHYDPATEEYSVTLNVHEHPIIILQQDRVFNLSCSRSSPESNNNSNPFNTIFNEPRQLQMGVYRQDAKIHHVLFGNPYTMRIESNGREDFTVTSCFGFAGQNDSLRLTDSNGCSTDMALISNFLYDPNAHAAQANLYSMFKFPEHDMIHLQCSVEICNGACPRVDCERRRDDPFPNNARNPFPAKQKKRRFTSTTIRVSDLGAPPEKLTDAQEIAVRATCGQHYQLLSAMCILFGCLFLVSIFVNFLFCCMTGYCCCSDHTSKYSGRSSSSPIGYVDPATFDRILASRNGMDNSNYRYPAVAYIESPSRNSDISKISAPHRGGVHLAHKRVGSCSVNQQSPGAASTHSFTSDKPLVLAKKRSGRVQPRQQELSKYLTTDDLPPPPKCFLASPSKTSSTALPL